MCINRYPQLGPTALGLVVEERQSIPYGAKPIQPEDSFCEEHGNVQVIAEYGHIDILSCGCEFDTRG